MIREKSRPFTCTEEPGCIPKAAATNAYTKRWDKLESFYSQKFVFHAGYIVGVFENSMFTFERV